MNKHKILTSVAAGLVALSLAIALAACRIR